MLLILNVENVVIIALHAKLQIIKIVLHVMIAIIYQIYLHVKSVWTIAISAIRNIFALTVHYSITGIYINCNVKHVLPIVLLVFMIHTKLSSIAQVVKVDSN